MIHSDNTPISMEKNGQIKGIDDDLKGLAKVKIDLAKEDSLTLNLKNGVPMSMVQRHEDSKKLTETTFSVDVEGDLCVPKSIRSVSSVNDEVIKGTIVSFDLCVELLRYFRQNPKALECTCGNPEIDAKIVSTFKKYGADIKTDPLPIKPETIKDVSPKILSLSSAPVIKSYEMIQQCKKIPGISDLLENPKLLKNERFMQPMKAADKAKEM